MINEDLRKLNDIGGRLKWTREKLGLKRGDVSQQTGVPMSNLIGREDGVRSQYAEEYKALAEYFNSLWQDSFPVNFPLYNGIEIRRITTMWILFGDHHE